ncbi:MAG: ribosome maturation factor RimM [Lachnospiraceae bacterium]|jgi:16S rRNA processing protein RimM
MEEMLRVGVISSTHGVRGEVKVYPTTDDPERFLDLDEVTLDAGREQIVLKIQNVKFFKNMVILKFKGYDNINDIEKYKGRDLLIRRDQAVDLDEDEYFITDLVGLKVVTEDGTVLGVLKEVMPTGANDVYIVSREDGKELLLPAIKECILNVDLEQGVMNIHLMDGLLDL